MGGVPFTGGVEIAEIAPANFYQSRLISLVCLENLLIILAMVRKYVFSDARDCVGRFSAAIQ